MAGREWKALPYVKLPSKELSEDPRKEANCPEMSKLRFRASFKEILHLGLIHSQLSCRAGCLAVFGTNTVYGSCWLCTMDLLPLNIILTFFFPFQWLFLKQRFFLFWWIPREKYLHRGTISLDVCFSFIMCKFPFFLRRILVFVCVWFFFKKKEAGEGCRLDSEPQNASLFCSGKANSLVLANSL